MNLNLLNPYQIIDFLKKENEELKARVAELESEVANDTVADSNNGQDTE